MTGETLDPRKRNLHERQAGASLLAIIVAVGIMGIAGAILSSNLVNSSHYAKRVDLNVDLLAIKTTVTNFMDCQATVGAKTQCLASTVYQLKMRGGAPLFSNNASSAWIVTGTCKNNALLVKAVGAHKDPVFQKIITYPDVFNGTSSFCSAMFNPSAGDPCQVSPQLKNGVTYNQSNGPNRPCCRTIDAISTNGAPEVPLCLANLEYARNGGGRCMLGGQTNPHVFCNGAGCSYMHENWLVDNGTTQGWDVDCLGNAEARVVCCPFK